jgi:cytochrome c oxidase assembly protein subunit 15
MRLKKIWFTGLIALTLLMIAVGGATRLTRSGLSIVEWKPITGILPPIGEEAWQNEFNKYQASPEYQKVNTHFELSDYKRIFFWEYFHRLLGRLIFLYTLIPGLILWRRGAVSGKLVVTLSGLVLFQGLMGWIMVKSGLNHEPRVSPFLLATHFFLALTLMVVAFSRIARTRTKLVGRIVKSDIFAIRALGVVLLLQILYGCLTSGFKAGYISNTFPLMHGSLFPSEFLFSHSPFWQNFFNNMHMVQWIHRWLGIITLSLIYAVTFLCCKKLSGPNRKPFVHLTGISTIQVIFGISLLIWQVPLWLAMLHQSIAALIVLGYCNIVFRIERAT